MFRTYLKLTNSLKQFNRCETKVTTRPYSKDECPCQKNGGVCTCGPDCKCPHCTKPCIIGPRLQPSREPPQDFAPDSLKTDAFSIEAFIKPKTFREIKEQDIPPWVGKNERYKNAEVFCYHRYSFYELKMATNAAKANNKCE